ncbi:MAG: transcriptional regulator [Sphingomonadales bacterium]|nr:transcriptional regulator [Sphingomonadales bacterium]MDE2168800.1 transcriptional regulator [Sphingomonadales bacterium]
MTHLPPHALDHFARHYPEVPHIIEHSLCDHPLMSLEALAQLAERLPAGNIEHAHADQPIGVSGKPPVPAISAADAIRQIDTAGCWVALTFIEQDPAYRALLLEVIEELRGAIEPRTGAVHKPQAFVFVSSPHAVTPYHFDPEHNILMQIRGSKVMTQFPAGDPFYSPAQVHEAYHTGGPRELVWRDEMLAGGTEFALAPGQGLMVPVMAPHFVRNGPQASISLSITWRSEWSYAESAAHAFNGVLRRWGMKPAFPGRWPARNHGKALAWRVMQKLGMK